VILIARFRRKQRLGLSFPAGPVSARRIYRDPAMKTSLTACVFLLVCTSIAVAQQPKLTRIERPPVATLQTPIPATTQFSAPTLTPPPTTPELWVYAQEMRRHDDPAQAVRRKAEFQADQRMSRLAALKWYGLSNSRPEASVVPMMGIYSPGWIGNGWDRYDWVASRGPSINVWLPGYELAR
jgi:hypothetical protein